MLKGLQGGTVVTILDMYDSRLWPDALGGTGIFLEKRNNDIQMSVPLTDIQKLSFNSLSMCTLDIVLQYDCLLDIPAKIRNECLIYLSHCV